MEPYSMGPVQPHDGAPTLLLANTSNLSFLMPETDHDLLSTIINGPKTPQKVFERLGLPVRTIEGVTTSGAGRSRKYHLDGKSYFSPEVLARAHYEAMGHTVAWNEGLGLRMALMAIERAATLSLFGHFTSTETPETLMTKAVERDATILGLLVQRYRELNPEATGMSDEQVGELVKLQPTGYRSAVEALKVSAALEPGKVDIHRRLPVDFRTLLRGREHEVQLDLDEIKWFACDCSAKVLIEEFHANLSALKQNPEMVAQHLAIPEVNPDKRDPTNFFKNEWTMAFAETVLRECTMDYLIHCFAAYGESSPTWDLTVIDGQTKELRFVEVKCKDDFTESQLGRLPFDIKAGTLLELCIVKTLD
ncbi:hypothetical protein [Hydrogenophaga sp.]|uniref:hypothetical protein n=1 Tax=Hydrogenophaga sp. TaxID=1904254 RepID=UPI00272AC778|nr:hypothetical protein [Hydrogenophaga sp.]